MVISSEIEGTLKRIPWFSRCGVSEEVEIVLPYSLVSTWQSALDALSDPAWEGATAEAQGDLTGRLTKKCPRLYQEWNTLVSEADKLVADHVMPSALKIQASQGLPKLFLDCVEWDIGLAVMEHSYAKYSPHEFFRTLLKVYEKGHFPCGWDGEWPNGTLLVI